MQKIHLSIGEIETVSRLFGMQTTIDNSAKEQSAILHNTEMYSNVMFISFL